jgi:hypothetical protein
VLNQLFANLVGFYLILMDLFDFCGFLAKKSGSGAQKEARSWGEVRFRPPTQNLYKPEVFDSPERFITT